MIELALLLINCTNFTQINELAFNATLDHIYSSRYNCVDFSYALAMDLNKSGCKVRMVTGWVDLGKRRAWHRWIETPDFQIEATPGFADLGVIVNTNLYHKSYWTRWGFVHRYGK